MRWIWALLRFVLMGDISGFATVLPSMTCYLSFTVPGTMSTMSTKCRLAMTLPQSWT